MIYQLRLLSKALREPDRTLAAVKSLLRNRKTEVFLMSYPKAGRTWLRVLLGRYLQLRNGAPESMVLDTYRLTGTAGLKRAQFTHGGPFNLQNYGHYASLSFDRERFGTRDMVFIKRDIRDILVSHYFEESQRMRMFEGTLSEFLRDESLGVAKVVAYTNFWYLHQNLPRTFHLTSYEALHHDAEQSLREVLARLGETEPDAALLAEAVEYARFGNLRSLEASGKFRVKALRPGTSGGESAFKTRKGKVGGYHEALSAGDLRYIEKWVEREGLAGCDWYFGEANR
ncbi:MAG: sulfotransferase domain-containing protein [Opitutales bacterium]